MAQTYTAIYDHVDPELRGAAPGSSLRRSYAALKEQGCAVYSVRSATLGSIRAARRGLEPDSQAPHH